MEEYINYFTPRAQQVLARARREADRLSHDFVGTEHLLLGLISLGENPAVSVLVKMGLDLEIIRAETKKHVGVGSEPKIPGNIPYTPRVKRVLALAAKESRALNHAYIGTEHILLGLLSEGDGVAARVLKNLGADIDVTRQYILRELDPNFGPNFSREAADPARLKAAEIPKRSEDEIDTTRRYDVYCREANQDVIYRNVLFRGCKSLFRKREFDISSEFIELEQADGQTVFVSKSSIRKFCEHGGTPSSEQAPVPAQSCP